MDGVENVKCGEKSRSPSGQTKDNDSDGKEVHKEEGEGGVDLREESGVNHDQGVDDLCQDAGKQEDAIQGGESHPPTKFPSLRKDTIDLTFEGVEGLNPDPEKHQFHMLVQVIELS